MKNYQLTLQVPDDFNPNEMSLNIGYEKGDLELIGEGFFDIQKLAEKISTESIEVTPSSVVIFKYPVEAASSPIVLQAFNEMLEQRLGCTVVGIVDDMKLLSQNSVEATKVLQQMIDKINSKAIIKLV